MDMKDREDNAPNLTEIYQEMLIKEHAVQNNYVE